MSTYTPRGQHRRADIAATVVLLVVHGFLFAATVALLGLLIMGTDACGAVQCGDPAWIDRATSVGIWAGAAILIADFFLTKISILIFR